MITAMFVVIFVEQWLKGNRHISEWVGLAASVGCLLIFGADSFLIPTMIYILAALTALRKPLTHGEGGMTITEQIITIAKCVLGTMLTRFLPFAVFRSSRSTPRYIQYLGKVLPGAVFAMLVIYCLRNVSLLQGSHGLPELLAIAVTVALHLWKRQMLLSIASGTICYMLLIQSVVLT